MAAKLTVLTDVLQGDDDRVALIVGSGGAEYTRAQVHSLATAFAVSLRKAGIKPGDLVTIAEPNTVCIVYPNMLPSKALVGRLAFVVVLTIIWSTVRRLSLLSPSWVCATPEPSRLPSTKSTARWVYQCVSNPGAS
jgi:acyl-CoA synthetase (AMP-forming)/AMP-acid ligase II